MACVSEDFYESVQVQPGNMPAIQVDSNFKTFLVSRQADLTSSDRLKAIVDNVLESLCQRMT